MNWFHFENKKVSLWNSKIQGEILNEENVRSITKLKA